MIHAGPGRRCEHNPKEFIPCDAKPGMVVYLTGTAVKFWMDGKEYGLIRDVYIVAEAPQG